MSQRWRMMKERLLLRSFPETKPIQRHRNLLQTQTVLSGCRTKGSQTPSRRMLRMSRLHCPKPCSGQSQLRAFRNPRPGQRGNQKPTWYLLAEEDRMINPKTQRFMAERMKATVRSFAVDHTPLLTAPDKVVDIILEAAKATLS